MSADVILSLAAPLTLLALAFGAMCGALWTECQGRQSANRHRGCMPPPLPPPLPNAVGPSSAVRGVTRAGRPV